MTDVKVHEFKVTMTCEGCSGAVERVLGKLKDNAVKEYKLLFEEQLIEVTTTLPVEPVLKALKTTGKEVTLVSST